MLCKASHCQYCWSFSSHEVSIVGVTCHGDVIYFTHMLVIQIRHRQCVRMFLHRKVRRQLCLLCLIASYTPDRVQKSAPNKRSKETVLIGFIRLGTAHLCCCCFFLFCFFLYLRLFFISHRSWIRSSSDPWLWCTCTQYRLSSVLIPNVRTV